MANQPTKSTGHVQWAIVAGEIVGEYYHAEGNVFRAPLGNPFDLNGYRQGGRWESSVPHWNRTAADPVFKRQVIEE